MEIVTGKAGTPHVSSADDGRRIAGEVGAGSYVLQTGGKLALSLVDGNTVRFATGDIIVQGRHIGITEPEDVKIASGTQGKKRMDYICVHYTKDVSGSAPTLVEKVEWTVLQGTPGTDATAPTVPSGSIINGDAEATVPIASVTFDGLTTGTPKLLIPELTPLAACGEVATWSATVTGGTGTIDVTCVNHIGVARVRAWPRGGDGSWAGDRLSDIELDERFRPKMDYAVPAWSANRTGEGDVVLKVNTDGTFAWQAQGGSQADEPLYGVLVWAY